MKRKFAITVTQLITIITQARLILVGFVMNVAHTVQQLTKLRMKIWSSMKESTMNF